LKRRAEKMPPLFQWEVDSAKKEQRLGERERKQRKKKQKEKNGKTKRSQKAIETRCI
jgi:hypothetical protein